MIRLLGLSLLLATAPSAQVTTVQGRAPSDWEQPDLLVWVGQGIGAVTPGFGGVVFVSALHQRHLITLRYVEGGPVFFGFGGRDQDDFPRNGRSAEAALLYGRALSLTEHGVFATSIGLGVNESGTEFFDESEERVRAIGAALGMQVGVRFRYVGAFLSWDVNLNRERSLIGFSGGISVGRHN